MKRPGDGLCSELYMKELLFIKEWVMPRVDDVLKWNKKRDATITGNRDYCYNDSSNLSL